MQQALVFTPSPQPSPGGRGGSPPLIQGFRLLNFDHIPSEIIRDALRLMEEREQLRQIQIGQLRQQIQAGIDSGEGIPTETVRKRLTEKFKNMAQA